MAPKSRPAAWSRRQPNKGGEGLAFSGHAFFLIFMLVFYGALIVLAVWLVLWAIRIAPHRIRPDSALKILNERFARGEIDQQEYDTKKAALLRH